MDTTKESGDALEAARSHADWHASLGRLVALMPCSAAAFDPALRLLHANRAWLELLGDPRALTANDEVGFIDLVAAADQARVWEFLRSGASQASMSINLKAHGSAILLVQVSLWRDRGTPVEVAGDGSGCPATASSAGALTYRVSVPQAQSPVSEQDCIQPLAPTQGGATTDSLTGAGGGASRAAEDRPAMLVAMILQASTKEPICGSIGPDATVPGEEEAQAFAKVANWELDLVTQQIHASRIWYALWGFDPEEEVNLDRVMARLAPQDRERIAQALRQAGEFGVPFRLRCPVCLPDGSERWLEAQCNPPRPEPTAPTAGQQPTQARKVLRGVVMDISEQHEAEQTLARYHDIVSASPDRLAFFDRGSRLQAANAAFLAGIHLSADEALGRPLHELAPEGALRELIYRRLGQCLDHGARVIEDIHEHDAQGRMREYEATLMPHRDARGRISGIAVNLRDVTNIRESERRHLQAAAIYAATSDAIIIADAQRRIVAVNDAFTMATGYAKQEVIGQDMRMIASHWHTPMFFRRMWRELVRTGAWQGECWNRRKDGEIILQSVSLRRILDQGACVANYILVLAKRRTALHGPRPAEDFVLYDPLTKLPNRALIVSRLANAMALAREDRRAIAFMLLDLDHFSHVNANLGHRIGDELLRSVGQRLREHMRGEDTLGRWDGNRFGFVFAHVAKATDAELIAQRFQRLLAPVIRVRGHQFYVTASIGIVWSDATGDSVELMIEYAESALRQVKLAGRNGFRMRSVPHADDDEQFLTLAERIRKALCDQQLKLYLQPRVALGSGRRIQVDAQLQWSDQVLGVVGWERLCEVARSVGLLADVEQQLLSEVCRALQQWQHQGMKLPTVAIPFSEIWLLRSDLVARVAKLLNDHHLNGQSIDLMFSEVVHFKQPERTRDLFCQLSSLGVGLTLRDIGMTWVGPGALRRLPLQTLKIHPGLVEAMVESPDDAATVQALIVMAQALELTIVADRVRTPQQRQLLLSMGCTQAVGELFGPLIPAAQFAQT